MEGIGTPEKPHPLQQAFIDLQAAQCGYCMSGVILSAKALLDKNPKAQKPEIERVLQGIICRCFTNARIVQAIDKVAR